MSKIVSVSRANRTYTEAMLDDGNALTIHFVEAGCRWYFRDRDEGRYLHRDADRDTLVARIWAGGIRGGLLAYAASELDESDGIHPDDAVDAAVSSVLDRLGIENPECLLSSGRGDI